MKVKVNTGYLSFDGALYSAGSVIDIPDVKAAEVIALSKGRISAASGKRKQPEPEKPVKAVDNPVDKSEEGAALPDADPVAAVQKK